jgi:hypothetical protein
VSYPGTMPFVVRVGEKCEECRGTGYDGEYEVEAKKREKDRGLRTNFGGCRWVGRSIWIY